MQFEQIIKDCNRALKEDVDHPEFEDAIAYLKDKHPELTGNDAILIAQDAFNSVSERGVSLRMNDEGQWEVIK